jgi:hypothetical protein
VAANRSTIRHADPVLDIGELAEALSAKSCVSLPVFAGADLFGALTVYVADPALSDERVDAAGLLGQEVGLLIARSANAVMRWYLRAAIRSSMAAVS